jgi:pimeloyl-ACP methyl ester carboxylesterase
MAKRQAVNERLEKGDIPGGTRLFVEEIAIGPGTWDLVPEEMRKTMIDNAPAYMEEQRDPGWASIDLQGLARFSAPVLLTHGDQSPPWFEQIAAQLAGAIEHAVREVFPGAGHLPHLTHAADYVSRVSAFIAASR